MFNKQTLEIDEYYLYLTKTFNQTINRSKESAINDTLTEIKSRCIHLSQANETYERLIKENEDLITCLKVEVTSVKKRCLELTLVTLPLHRITQKEKYIYPFFVLFCYCAFEQENEKINNTLKSKVENLTNLTSTIANLTEENTRLQDKFDTLSAENRDLVASLQSRVDQVTQLKAELDNIKLVW